MSESGSGSGSSSSPRARYAEARTGGRTAPNAIRAASTSSARALILASDAENAQQVDARSRIQG
jgi:hypothetical protein